MCCELGGGIFNKWWNGLLPPPVTYHPFDQILEKFFFLNNRKTIILEVCPHPKLVTHQFICFGSAELTIHMFCKDKIAELIIAASKKKNHLD